MKFALYDVPTGHVKVTGDASLIVADRMAEDLNLGLFLGDVDPAADRIIDGEIDGLLTNDVTASATSGAHPLTVTLSGASKAGLCIVAKGTIDGGSPAAAWDARWSPIDLKTVPISPGTVSVVLDAAGSYVLFVVADGYAAKSIAVTVS